MMRLSGKQDYGVVSVRDSAWWELGVPLTCGVDVQQRANENREMVQFKSIFGCFK